MARPHPDITRILGIVGSLACIVIFILRPSFPTPDKLLIFAIFIFMAFRQTIAMLKRMLPFVVIILTYESFRGIIPSLHNQVNYTFAPRADEWLFGNLPTVYLQNWLWHGHTQWYDLLLYLPYMLFFAMPFGLAILIWKTRAQYYWQAVTAYTIVFYGAFLTFLLFPAAPPWLAAQNHLIEPITRISSHVWFSLGISDFPSLYNHIAPNPVAAVPSLHSACSTLFALLIFKLYGRRWGLLALLYPLLIYFGVIYEGEHYAFDVIVGILYALAAYWLMPYVTNWLGRIKNKYWPPKTGPKTNSASSTKNA